MEVCHEAVGRLGGCSLFTYPGCFDFTSHLRCLLPIEDGHRGLRAVCRMDVLGGPAGIFGGTGGDAAGARGTFAGTAQSPEVGDLHNSCLGTYDGRTRRGGDGCND